MRSTPVCQGTVCSARCQRWCRASAPAPAVAATEPTMTSARTTRPASGTGCPQSRAMVTAAAPGSTPGTTAIRPPAPATLASWLRTRSDEQLAALLATRPDVARPAPSDVVALASRLAVPVSVDRALDELDAGTLQVLDVVLLADSDGVDAADLPAALPAVPDDVLQGAVDRLATRALLWGDDVLHAPEPVRRAVRHPAGLGRRASELRLTLPTHLPKALAELPAEEREVLERLAGDRPVGHLPDTDGGATSPARRLLQRGLLARIDALNVELPREMGLQLRGSLPYGPPRVRPEPAVVERDPAVV